MLLLFSCGEEQCVTINVNNLHLEEEGRKLIENYRRRNEQFRLYDPASETALIVIL